MNISTSLICCDLSDIKSDLDVIVEHEGFNWLHADFMDGHFVPRYGISPELIQWLRKRYGDKVVIDSHLMVDNPYDYAPVIAPYSDWYFFHYEAVTDPMRTLQMLRKNYPNLKIGLTFNICTPLLTIENVIVTLIRLGYIDGVMFMGISPGVLGTDSFPTEVARRISLCSQHTKVFVDGSVNYKTVKLYKEFGATTLVSGSSMMFKVDDETKNLTRPELIEYNINRINKTLYETQC